MTPEEQKEFAATVAMGVGVAIADKPKAGIMSKDHVITLLIALAAWFAVEMVNDIRKDPDALETKVEAIQSDITSLKGDVSVINTQLTSAKEIADRAGVDRYTSKQADADHRLSRQLIQQNADDIEVLKKRILQ